MKDIEREVKELQENIIHYRENKLELEELEAEISGHNVKDSVQGSMKEYPFVLSTRRIEGVDDEKMLIKQSDLKSRIRAAEDFVNSMTNSEIRSIIKLRYMRGRRPLSWQSIALKLGYRAEHTPKRKLEKYFEMSEMSDFG